MANRVEKEVAGMEATFKQILATLPQPNISAVVEDGLEQLEDSLDVIISMRFHGALISVFIGGRKPRRLSPLRLQLFRLSKPLISV